MTVEISKRLFAFALGHGIVLAIAYGISSVFNWRDNSQLVLAYTIGGFATLAGTGLLVSQIGRNRPTVIAKNRVWTTMIVFSSVVALFIGGVVYFFMTA